MINIGRMDELIELRHPGEIDDGMGGRTVFWGTIDTVWAEFLKPRLSTMQESGSVVSEMVREIRIRNRTDVRKGWRVICGAKTFDVEHAYDPDRESTIIVCREVVR